MERGLALEDDPKTRFGSRTREGVSAALDCQWRIHTLMPPEEVYAKAMIAAALIQTREVDVTVQVDEPGDEWTEYAGMRRLHLLTNLIYDAIASPK